MFKDIKTSVGGIVCIMAVIGLLAHWIDVNACVVILGFGGGLIGLGAKDSGATSTITTESISKNGVTATSTTVEPK